MGNATGRHRRPSPWPSRSRLGRWMAPCWGSIYSWTRRWPRLRLWWRSGWQGGGGYRRAGRLKMILAGRRLDDDSRRVSEYGVQKNSELHVLFAGEGAGGSVVKVEQ
mmetsp:Transcript_27003/g.87223  ORF Transcript_27003/g.87223 Transcript_27003/m.87223 type:complete len:107 (+) Transcript_27003:267-587(+)